MKKTFTLLAGSVLWLGLAAQQTNTPTDNIPQWYKDRHPERFQTQQNNPSTNATFKTEALNSRLIGYNYEEWTAGAWVENDSTAMTFSGTRGGDWNVSYDIQPDQQTDFNWNAGAWEKGADTIIRTMQLIYQTANSSQLGSRCLGKSE
jgi:hypothetical protein